MGHNLLRDAIVTAALNNGASQRHSLPDLLAALLADSVTEFPRLRPHQRQAWHAFLVQLCALAMVHTDRKILPETAEEWRGLLRGLTADWPNEEPWCLIAATNRPALLQAPLPDGDLKSFKEIETPDLLDMLVTSKNHDLKRARMKAPGPEEWLFALVTLQTMEGYLGAGNFGISRMNGGFANRPALGVLPPGGPGARFRRDLSILLRRRTEILDTYTQFKEQGGLGLVWLQPWNGVDQIALDELDPFYVEICRRIRLVEEKGQLQGLAGTSRKARIAAGELNGATGDPWMPVEVTGDGVKALSITAEGFSYRKMSELLLGERYKAALLQEIDPEDGEDGLSILACGLARGQGKTEGFHERRVPISQEVVRWFAQGHSDRLAAVATERVNDAGTLRGKVLRPALFVLLQDGPESANYGNKATDKELEPWLKRYETRVDEIFFPRLWAAFDETEDTPQESEDAAKAWQQSLAGIAREVLERASDAVPLASMRRYRAWSRSQGIFQGLLYKNFTSLRPEPKEKDDAAA